jgi:hypothetical protein
MTFNLTRAQEKRLFLLQKKNFEELGIKSDSILDLIQFPESSVFIERIKTIADSKRGTEIQGAVHLFVHLFEFAAIQSTALFLILPGLSPQTGFTYARYPAIKVKARQLRPLLESIQGRFIEVDYFALVSEDFKHGVVFDIYAGNPEIHGTDKEICRITKW